MSYKHLSIEDRSKIEVLYQDYTVSQIAEAIGRHRSMIYRELKRVKSARYVAQLAQANATEHQSLKVVVLNIRPISFKIFKQS